jgi:hypothetical protein
MFIEASYGNPTRPDPATGHIYSLNNHGHVVYITAHDWWRIYGTMSTAWLTGCGMMLVAWLKRQKQGRSQRL